jgi:hypothetical protein
MPATDDGNRRIEIFLARRRQIANAQLLFTVATDKPSRFGQSGIVITQKGPRLLSKGMPLASGTHTGGSPFQYSSAEIVLEQLHLPCERWLRNVQALGSAAKAAFLKDH